MIRPYEPLKRTVARVCRARGGDPLYDLTVSCYLRRNRANDRFQAAHNAYMRIPVGGAGEQAALKLSTRWSVLGSALFECFSNSQGLHPRPDLACKGAREALRHPDLPSIEALFAQKQVP